MLKVCSSIQKKADLNGQYKFRVGDIDFQNLHFFACKTNKFSDMISQLVVQDQNTYNFGAKSFQTSRSHQNITRPKVQPCDIPVLPLPHERKRVALVTPLFSPLCPQHSSQSPSPSPTPPPTTASRRIQSSTVAVDLTPRQIYLPHLGTPNCQLTTSPEPLQRLACPPLQISLTAIMVHRTGSA